jgi:hypothetical protein
MNQSINYKLKTEFSTSNDASLSHPTQNTFISKSKKCSNCNKKRKIIDKINHICHTCYKMKTATLSGNKVIDDFIKGTLSNCNARMKLEFVPYDKFKNIEFIAEGGFSKIYKATWIDGPLSNRWNKEKQKSYRRGKMRVVLKELNNSKNIDSKELNEV